jgi:DNA repair protein RecO (recombination protein O)
MARERTFRSEAIILRRTDFGEADRLLTLYSLEFGKMKAIAKGARKPQSRKTGHVEPLMRTRFLFAKGRDLSLITQAEMLEAYPGLRADLLRASYGSYAMELLDRFTVEDDKNEDVYRLAAEGLSWFELADDLQLTARFYELRLLTLVGYRPQLFQCVSCDEDVIEQDQFFSPELGGLLCPKCQTRDRMARRVTAVSVKVLRYLQTRDWDTIKVLQLKPLLHGELESLMHHYLTFILERNLKSLLPDNPPEETNGSGMVACYNPDHCLNLNGVTE